MHALAAGVPADGLGDPRLGLLETLRAGVVGLDDTRTQHYDQAVDIPRLRFNPHRSWSLMDFEARRSDSASAILLERLRKARNPKRRKLKRRSDLNG